jgi:type VI secretion system protein ImpK
LIDEPTMSSEPIFDPPDADDTIRRPLPQIRQTSRPSSDSLFLDDGFDAAGDNEFKTAFSRPRARRSDDFDDLLGTGGGFPDDFGSDTYLKSGKEGAIEKAFDLASVNPLVSAAAPLLWLAGRLNESAPPEDVERFRQRILAEIKQFETAAMARDVPPRLVRMSRYAIAATLDDIILNTEWGGQAVWQAAVSSVRSTTKHGAASASTNCSTRCAGSRTRISTAWNSWRSAWRSGFPASTG